MRDGVDGAWIHHNTLRQMGHAFIAIENLDRHEETKSDGTTGQGYLVTGVHNCIIEDNLLEGGNSCYARAFNICGGFNLNGDNLCTNNVYRRNQVYDMTTSSHLNGHYNLIYSNVFSYTHCHVVMKFQQNVIMTHVQCTGARCVMACGFVLLLLQLHLIAQKQFLHTT